MEDIALCQANTSLILFAVEDNYKYLLEIVSSDTIVLNSTTAANHQTKEKMYITTTKKQVYNLQTK